MKTLTLFAIGGTAMSNNLAVFTNAATDSNRYHRLRRFQTSSAWLLAACLFVTAATQGIAQTYTIRPAGGPVGGYVSPPVQALLSDDGFEFDRPAMSVNLSGQFVTGGLLGSSSYLVLPAPAYGLAAGYHLLPSGFTAQAIGYGGHIVGIVASNKTVAVWTNGVLRNLGKLNFNEVINVDVNYRGVVAGTALTRLAGRTFNSAAFIAQPGDTDLQLMFPGYDGSTAAFGMNTFADVVGLDFPTGGSMGRFVTRGGDTTQPGTREYLLDILWPEVINDWGDVSGIKYPIQISTNTSQGSHVFTYAPNGGTDLPHTVAEETNSTYSGVFAINGRGQVLCYADGYYLYQSGALKKLDDLIPANSGWQQLIGADLNDNGWIVGSGTYKGQSSSAFVMIPVGLDARASVSQGTVAFGENVTFTVVSSNATSGASAMNLTQVQPSLFPLDGNGQVIYVNGPIPAIATLAPGQSTNFAYTLKATIPGRIRIFAQGSAKNAAATSYYLNNVLSDYVYAPLDIGELSAFIEATPRQVKTNEIIHVTLTAHNESSSPVTAVRPVGSLTVSGSGGVQLVTGPLPTNIVSLAAHSTGSFDYDFRATQEGRVTFSGRVQGTTANSPVVQSFDAFSAPVTIGLNGDMLIKRASEVASSYAIDNEYQTAPAGQQVRTNTVAKGELSEFHVQIQNDDSKPRIYMLRVTALNTPGWNVKYLLNGSPVGVILPQLASNAFHTITVQMTPTNAVAGDQRRALLELLNPLDPTEIFDVVEAVTDVAAEIIVNTTGDEPDADVNDNLPDVDLNKPGVQTTLRCAIDFANRRAGKDIIKFQIPPEDPNWVDGVPQIEPATALPEITGTVIIDGWTQNTNALTPPVALCGKLLPRPPRPTSLTFPHEWPGAIRALMVQGEACEIRGLVINQFPAGPELAGAGSHVLEGCFIGVNAAGTESRGNGLWGAGWFGVPGHPLGDGQPLTRPRGWDVRVTSPQNRLGGTQPRQHNVFGSVAGFVDGGSPPADLDFYLTPVHIWVRGPAAFGTQIVGNRIGVRPDDSALLPHDAYVATHLQAINYSGIEVENAPGTLIGGSAAGDGNVIGGASVAIKLIGADTQGTAIWGNAIGVNHARTVILLNNDGVIAEGTGSVDVGGLNPGQGNVVSPDTYAVCVFLGHLTGPMSRVLGNQLGWLGALNNASPQTLVELSPGSVPMEVRGNTISGFRMAGVRITGEENNPASTVQVIDNNFSTGQSGAAIEVAQGRGHSLFGNRLTGSEENRLIRLGFHQGFDVVPPLPNDDFDLDGGPNNKQNWPVMATALLTGGQLQVQAGVDTGILSGQYSLHVYRCFADQWYHGQPQELVATGMGTADASGRAAFTATVATGPVAEGDFLCATATGPDGSTSEVGPVRRVIGGPDFDADGNGDATESRVPNRPSGLGKDAGFGDGNGDGTPDSQQAYVASLPVAAGKWLTIVAPGGLAFSNVQFTAIPTLTDLPPGYTFPLGFVSFTLNGLTPGATVSVTNILHDSFALTTVFAYGPTSGNTQPHWYNLNSIITGDEVRLTFADGSNGDHDLASNGSITTLYGLAYQLPPVPQLSILSATPKSLSIVFPDDSGANSITNILTALQCALAWPAAYTNYTLEYAVSLSAHEWFPLTDEAAIIGDKLVVTNVSVDPMRFYRLRPGFVTLAQVPVPTLNIQRTSTNTFLLSWLASSPGFSLQQNAGLGNTNWLTVTNSVIVTNGQNQVLIPPATGSRFFRLRSF